MLQKLGAHAVGICLRLVDLVDGDDDRNAGGLGMIDGFDRLRHDAIVRRHDEHDDVRHLAPRARMAVNASWPGVSMKVMRSPRGVVTW